MSKRGAKNLRNALVRDVQQRLTRIFLEKEFSPVPLPPEEAKSELKTAFPLGRLKRKRGNELDVIEFQFDKYSRLRFVINFGIVPEGGVTLPWGDHLDQNVADASSLPDAYRLFSSSFRKRWFQLSLLTPRNEQAISRLVDKAIVLSTEINIWFEFKTVGKHMKKFGFLYNNSVTHI